MSNMTWGEFKRIVDAKARDDTEIDCFDTYSPQAGEALHVSASGYLYVRTSDIDDVASGKETRMAYCAKCHATVPDTRPASVKATREQRRWFGGLFRQYT